MSSSSKDLKQSWQELLNQAFHGMVCAKTGPLILLATASATSFDINIIVFIFEGFILKATKQVGKTITSIIPYNVIFYHQHRMAHLPIVYTHAHKVIQSQDSGQTKQNFGRNYCQKQL